MTYPEFVQFLKDTGMSSEEIGSKLQVGKSTVERWLSGNFTPHPLMMKDAVKILTHMNVGDESDSYDCGCLAMGIACQCYEGGEFL